jgi:hypothetical protein
MKSRRGLLILAVPALGIALLIGALVAQREDAPRPIRRIAPVAAAPRPASAPPRRAAPPLPASEAAIARAMDESRVRAHYSNYRNAVASGNRILQQALLPALLHEREAALILARREVESAPSSFDLDVAQRTLEALRNQP